MNSDRSCELAGNGAGDRAAEIADRARDRNRARSRELASWVDLARERELSDQERAVAAEVAHQLAGSAGTFGYLRTTEIARELEQLLAPAETVLDWARAEACVAEISSSLDVGPDLQL